MSASRQPLTEALSLLLSTYKQEATFPISRCLCQDALERITALEAENARLHARLVAAIQAEITFLNTICPFSGEYRDTLFDMPSRLAAALSEPPK